MRNRTITIYELSIVDGETLGFYPSKKTARYAATEYFERTGDPMNWREHVIADNSAGVATLVNVALKLTGENSPRRASMWL